MNRHFKTFACLVIISVFFFISTVIFHEVTPKLVPKRASKVQDKVEPSNTNPIRQSVSLRHSQTTPKAQAQHSYASIFQSLCAWNFNGVIEKSEERCCQFTESQRTTLVKAMAPFVALTPAAPLNITQPPFFARDRLDCNTPRWTGAKFFTGQLRDSRPLVVDMFIVAAEMDLMEARLWELSESVDYILVGISLENHRGDPQPNWYKHARDHHYRFPEAILSKVLVVDVSNCEGHKAAKKDSKNINNGAEFSHQLSQRYCLWKHGIKALENELKESRDLNNVPDDTIFLFTDVDELPNREMVYHFKHCQLKPQSLPAHLRMRVAGHNFRVPCSDGIRKHTGASEMAEWRTIKEDGGAIYRFRAPDNVVIRQKNFITDAGIHLTWYGSMAFVDFKGFTHAEGGYFTPMWFGGADNKEKFNWKDIFVARKKIGLEGDYCSAQNSDENHVMEKRQNMANDYPLKFVRFWEHHDDEKPLERIAHGDTSKLYACNLPWVAVENPARFVWFWGEGRAAQIDELADVTILNNLGW